ncbi:MAG: DUF3106 domain-containing protein [Thioalkalispiraceae bacterium]
MTIARIRHSVIAVALLSLLFAHGQAQPSLAWEQLSETEQQVLQKYAAHWHSLQPRQQKSLRQVARAWQKMTAEQRASMQQRLSGWQQTPAQVKQKIRDNYRQFMQLTPEQQQRIRLRRQAFQQLPVQEQQKLKQQWLQAGTAQTNGAKDQVPEKHGEDKTVRQNDSSEQMKQDEPRLNGNRALRNNHIQRKRIDRPTRRPR